MFTYLTEDDYSLNVSRLNISYVWVHDERNYFPTDERIYEFLLTGRTKQFFAIGEGESAEKAEQRATKDAIEDFFWRRKASGYSTLNVLPTIVFQQNGRAIEVVNPAWSKNAKNIIRRYGILDKYTADLSIFVPYYQPKEGRMK